MLAGIAIMHALEPDPLATLASGDWLRMDPGAGTVAILRRSAQA